MNAIDEYLATVAGWQQDMLLEWQAEMLKIEPDSEQVIYYGVPCFKVDGQAIGGFAAYKNHCAYFPFSGQTLVTLSDELRDFNKTSGSLHVKETQKLTPELIALLIAARKVESAEGYGHRKKK
ncbi:DUF1801 domain-containing protein [Rhodoluna sp. KAS3]|uniref:iron chaperone n=1 Tax=Rhodoluna sp. KAS3 TaxID=942880 RepID=UPI002231FCC9|nr:DUF1801 domain-containing protein [Rhodoluna sp. KAS3]BDS49340.1 hypothetical protein RKAS3_09170 [Rhodoluna sp. KAS3]